MVEARYKGTKVVAVSPDYAISVKFADTWLPVEAGMDAAVGMAMTHVILKENYADRQTPYFIDYVKQYTDLPFLITLDPYEDNYRAGKYLRAENLGMEISHNECKNIVLDKQKQTYAVPDGTIGHRWENNQTWNLHLRDTDNKLGDIDPVLSFIDTADRVVDVSFPEFMASSQQTFKRRVPVKKITIDGVERYVTTVFDLLMANCGVSRGLPGEKQIE